MRARIRFKVGIIATILLTIAALTTATLATVWVISTHAAEESAASLFETVARNSHERIDRQMQETLGMAEMGAAHNDLNRMAGDPQDFPVLPFLLAALQGDPSFYSLYYGFSDGSFLQVIAARGDARILAAHKAPPGTQWILRTITLPSADAGAGATGNSGSGEMAAAASRVQTWKFLDIDNRKLDERVEPNPSFDPRNRPWYTGANLGVGAGDAAQLSPVYVFDSVKQPGITASKRLANRRGVFGVDVTLEGLQNFVAAQKISPAGGIILYDEQARLLAISNTLATAAPLSPLAAIDAGVVKAVIRAGAGTGADQSFATDDTGRRLMLRVGNWQNGERRIGIAIAAPLSDFSGALSQIQRRIALSALLAILVFVPIAWIFSSHLSQAVVNLAQEAERVRNLDFSPVRIAPSRVMEFHELGEAFRLMKETLEHKTLALAESQAKLARLVDLGIAMSAERDENQLMEMMLLGAKELTNADGGTLYTIDDSGALQFQILRNDTLKVALGGTSRNPVTIPPVPLFDADGKPNHSNVVSHTVHTHTTVKIADAYDSTGFDFSGTRAFDQRTGYRSQSFMTVPLKPRGGDVIGALQLINARSPSSETVPFSDEIQRFIEALAAQAATALYNRELLAAQERLMDSMIQLIAGAIDAKSPYTGGHCERVPELAVMLAEEAERVDHGPLADFGFAGEEDWREFRIGAWLHDCGKVITPEFIVDKATKLETIFNRIHEIRTRFEILLRDAEIERLNSVAAGTDADTAGAAFEARQAQLTEDFAFLAECNIGGEFMAPDKLERLKAIGQTTWVRHFDDQLGLAHDELKRYPAPAALPAVERLLDDKPQHRIPRPDGARDPYEGLGFKLKTPEFLYDLGELHNLSISRGTLTDEDRFKINEHIMQTIAMLERLPFPKHLRRVPEYAGTHHETLTGSGYPRKLTKDQLSVPARIMAIADIFEALTASDRPYKKAKTLSESVKILSFFKKDGHIDPDLFDLFLTSGIYRRYAERFLQPEQLDEVEIERYLTPVAPAALIGGPWLPEGILMRMGTSCAHV